jgi:pimeloyl-ACP methyl ester carboxylesterase
MDASPITPRRPARHESIKLRGLRMQLLHWNEAVVPTPDRPLLLLTHGWMDVAASFQFMVDALREERRIVALDWRGFGGSAAPQPTDAYWFPDYLGDLDALLDRIRPEAKVDLLGHSMGANVAMVYAGVRPERVRRLVNLEGFGMPATVPELAPRRYAQWLDGLKAPQTLRDYASADEVAERLRKNNPRLTPERAAWLAPHWAKQDASSGRWVIQGDPAHKRINPVLYRVDEILACWQRIEAPVLWVEGAQTDVAKFWGKRYPREQFEQRIAVVPRLERAVIDDCAHMLHHDQPEALAAHVEAFLDAP